MTPYENTNLDTLCYICEQTSFEEDYSENFGYEVHPSAAQGRFFVTFPAVLQSFGVRNRNQREYDASNIMDKIEHDEFIQEQLRKNSWIGEIDHPAPEKNGEELTMQRISNPSKERSSHYINRPYLNGNLLEAKIQTDSGTDAGMNMAISIVDRHIIPCFSARVLGSLQNRGGKPIVYVKKLITYDWVMFPSHREAEAKIKVPVMESVQEAEQATGCTIIFLPQLAQMAAANSRETEWLCESFGLTMNDVIGLTDTGNSVVINEGASTYIQPISDKTIRAKTQSMLKDWLHK